MNGCANKSTDRGLKAASFTKHLDTKSLNSGDQAPEFSSLGGGLFGTILKKERHVLVQNKITTKEQKINNKTKSNKKYLIARMGFMPAYGGNISAISMAVIPRLHMSALKSYLPEATFSNGQAKATSGAIHNFVFKTRQEKRKISKTKESIKFVENLQVCQALCLIFSFGQHQVFRLHQSQLMK